MEMERLLYALLLSLWILSVFYLAKLLYEFLSSRIDVNDNIITFVSIMASGAFCFFLLFNVVDMMR